MRRRVQERKKGWFCIKLLLITGLCILLLASSSVAGSKRVVKTKHTVLTFNNQDDLEKFEGKIQYGDDTSFASLFSSLSQKELEVKLIRKVDKLFEKVQLILDMRKMMKPVKVRVYSNEEQLHKAFRKIYKRTCEVRGWYLYEFNTVFLNVQDVHEGMLAHELGHAIIDHFLSVRPPRATAEILAKYVDKHLFEEVRKY